MAVEGDLALGAVHQAHDGLQRAALARAIAADERHDFASGHVERDLACAERAAVADLQVANAEQRHDRDPDRR